MTVDLRLEAIVVDALARDEDVGRAEHPPLPRPLSPLPYSISRTVNASAQPKASQECQESLHHDEPQHAPPLAEVASEFVATLVDVSDSPGPEPEESTRRLASMTFGHRYRPNLFQCMHLIL